MTDQGKQPAKPTEKKHARRAISKARLYKEVSLQAVVYNMGTEGVTLQEFLEKLGSDVIKEATS